MTAPAVTTLPQVKIYMQIPDGGTAGSPLDPLIDQLIPQVSQRFRKYTGREFGTFQYTEFYSGTGYPALVLRQRPVDPEGLRVWVDNGAFWGQGNPPNGPFSDQTELEPGTFALEIDDNGLSGSGLLYRVQSVWPMAKARLWQNQSPDLAADFRVPTGNIKVVYTAGELPDDIVLAANMTISAILQGNKTGSPIQDFSYEDFSIAVASFVTGSGLLASIPPQALEILGSYRELNW
jgi:hypothetical protein